MGGLAGGLGWEVGGEGTAWAQAQCRRELRAGQCGAGHRESVIWEPPGNHLPAGPT